VKRFSHALWSVLATVTTDVQPYVSVPQISAGEALPVVAMIADQAQNECEDWQALFSAREARAERCMI
jgi:hypothetical protein